ncbi:uncharacterized protein LOC8040582 [Ixodes scapularis]|uniref:uncharacterized protein LOC8040582 n=1 Tax=Ixodes scapularis TaxID=6945 RepID=UPI001A9EA857|nr:uncharacterized protein LOC8040582 [Ixodes scapularis]
MPPQLRKRLLQPEKQPQSCPASTEANNWARLRRYAAYLERQVPGIPRAKEIFLELKDMSFRFMDDFFAVCTETSVQPCHLVDRFDFWNSFLQEMNMELSEKEAGRFGLHYAAVWNMPDERRRSYFLLHWLLKQHCCIKTLWIEHSFAPEYLHLLCDALHLNCGLEELVLRCKMDGEALKILIPAVSTSLKSLVRLEMSSFRTPECALDSLGAALQKASGLASLDLHGICMDVHNAELLLSGLATCPSLVELSVQDYFLLPREGAVLAEFVAESSALKQFRLTCAVCFQMKPLETFLKGLASNRNLEELRLLGFDLEKPTTDLLVEAAANHSALKILDVGCSDELIDGGSFAKLVARNTGLRELMLIGSDTRCVAAFSGAILKNTRLQKLQLSLIGMKIDNYRELLEALSCNLSLQELDFDYVPDVFLGDLCQLVQETGNRGRVKIQADFEHVQVLTDAVKKCSALTQMSYSPERDGPPLPRNAFSELIHYHQLMKLSIYGRYETIESECLSDLALFLSRTTTLKEAYLHFRTAGASSGVLLEAVLRNRSLSKLWICDWTFEQGDLQRLCDIVRTNRNLRELHLHLTNCRENWVAYSLAKHIYSNLSLLRVTVDVHRWHDSKVAQLQIHRATQRNSLMLLRAVQFVTGSRGKRYAEAFEKIFDLPSLVEAVQKSANEHEQQAKEMVKSSKRFLDYNFLAAVGVVRDAVVCEPNGQSQLDCVGLDNWLQIRQYLKVADIKPEPVVGFYRPRRPQKRSRLH